MYFETGTLLDNNPDNSALHKNNFILQKLDLKQKEKYFLRILLN